MSMLDSPIEEIRKLFFYPPMSGIALTITRAVRLKANKGWLLECQDGRVFVTGEIEKAFHKSGRALDEIAEDGTLWGFVLEGLVELRKIRQEHLDEHRRYMKARVAARDREKDLETARVLAEKHGWAFDMGD